MMILSVVIIAGCGTETASPNATHKSIFTDPEIITKAMAELREMPELKGKDLKLFQDVTVSDIDGEGNVIDLDVDWSGTGAAHR